MTRFGRTLRVMKTTLYSLKPGFQALLRPVARTLVRAGATANDVTASTCVLSCSTGFFVALCLSMDFECQARSALLALPAVLFIRMALNAIDGIMAREFGQQSALGAYLNELTDVLSDTFLYLPFAFLRIFDPFDIAAVIMLSVISEMAGTVAVLAGASRRYDGPMGKSDRAFVFGALALWVGTGRQISRSVAPWLLRSLCVLLVLTIINRVKKGLEEHAQTTRTPLPF